MTCAVLLARGPAFAEEAAGYGEDVCPDDLSFSRRRGAPFRVRLATRRKGWWRSRAEPGQAIPVEISFSTPSFARTSG